ncbi:hypothetical protein AAD017_19445 [Proteus terrae]|uniref:hypothetical protein n=1 Tax=Proteus terrae TaxID=1574161 RepID=UPI0038AE654B
MVIDIRKYIIPIYAFAFYTIGSYFSTVVIGEDKFQLLFLLLNVALTIIRFDYIKSKLTYQTLTAIFILMLSASLIVIGWVFNSNTNGFGFLLLYLNPVWMFSLFICKYDEPLPDLEFSIKLIIYLSIVFLSLEFISRFLFPSQLGTILDANKVAVIGRSLDRGDSNFYIYKVISYLRFDSNGVGNITFLLAALCAYLSKYIDSSYKKFALIFLCFSILTFSRAAIAVSFIIILMCLDRRTLIKVSFIAGIMFTAITYQYSNFFEIEGSGETKFEVWDNFIIYLTNVDFFKLLIGNGLAADIFDPSITYVVGKFGHNLIVFLIFYLGLVGAILYFLIVGQILSKNILSTTIFLLFIIMGFSYFRPFEPFIFLVFAIITKLNYMRKSNDTD